ncbi:PREDICTED: uncharacterized protein LOC106341071 [Brassica oleracea var. oleracea]|uniref:uncharacterized protein LOC106341071 n=1 Tax=Brassica oleracea var. oleracea TaxID=109376 RepID=UPI0006A6DA62|nr:PREDICTED: uncharacterized protein LOC106341071 [Brassica oleracea var. oleracea]
MESTESWEPGTVILKRSGPLIKQQRRSCVLLREILKELLIKVPCGKSKQFVLISYDGSSHPISTPNVRHWTNAEKDEFRVSVTTEQIHPRVLQTCLLNSAIYIEQ